MPTIRYLVVALTVSLVLLVVGCSTGPQKPAGPVYEGKAHYKRIAEPEGTQHYTLSRGESFIKPVLERNPDPVYPAALVDQALPPVGIVARLSVDTGGRVTAVYISEDSSQPGHPQAFEKAVRDATRRWVFTPLRITREITRDGAPATLVVAPKPFSLWFKFQFEVVNGKPVTSSRAR